MDINKVKVEQELETYRQILTVVESYDSLAAVRGYLHSMIDFRVKMKGDNDE